MKKYTLFLLINVLIATNMNAQNNVISAFLMKWENSKNYLLDIAEAMPEANYNYKPTERQMTFMEQLIHIRNNMVWLSESYFVDSTYAKSEKITIKTKAEILKELNTAFDKVTNIIKNIPVDELTTEVDFFAGPKSKLQILNLLQDHATHHRAQIIVYLNLNNIQPPKYVGW
jgi:uncharacterized damage-inducible protein DinB